MHLAQQLQKRLLRALKNEKGLDVRVQMAQLLSMSTVTAIVMHRFTASGGHQQQWQSTAGEQRNFLSPHVVARTYKHDGKKP